MLFPFYVALMALLFNCMPCIATATSPLLLIVGDVTGSTVRILYDAVDRSLVLSSLYVELLGQEPHVTPSQAQSVVIQNAPGVVLFVGLVPGHAYTVQFGRGLLKEPEAVEFRTFANAFPVRVLALSCDRWREDGDNEGWEQLLSVEGKSWDAMLHLGDQIYADSVFRAPFDNVTFEGMLEAFRGLYREQWGRPLMQRVLRQGAHWMLPDDHEIVNNFHWYHLQGCKTASCASTSDDVAIKARAGLQALLEYEVQLYRDVNELTEQLHMGLPPHFHVLFARQVGSLGLLFLDTRLDRALAGLEAQPSLMSLQQLEAVKQHLSAWAEDDTVAHVAVVSSLPLLMHTDWAAEIAYQFDGEQYSGHAMLQNATVQLLQCLMEVPKTKLLVSGDMHLFAQARACLKGRCVHSVVTSGMTRGATSLNDFKLYAYHFIVTRLTSQSIEGWRWSFQELFFGRNYAWIQTNADGELLFGGTLGPVPATVAGRVGHFLVTQFHAVLKTLAAIVIVRFLVSSFTN